MLRALLLSSSFSFTTSIREYKKHKLTQHCTEQKKAGKKNKNTILLVKTGVCPDKLCHFKSKNEE